MSDAEPVLALFEACLDRSEVEVDALLADASPAVAAEVRALLAHDRAAGAFLAAPVEPPVPERVGRFVIGARLGEGGMGVVYVARDPHLGREVAVKVLGGFRLEPERRRALLGEARALAQISHPHVVQVFEADEQDGQVFVVMELVRGQTLRAWLATPRPWRAALQVMLEVGAGLAAIHAAGLVHRDVKPENVLVGDDGRARVLDLGLAHAARAHEDAAAEPHELRGTPRYMAPEQWVGAVPDARSDQYAFAVTAVEALTGRPPPLDARARAVVPDAVWPPLWRALEPEPHRRYAALPELLAALGAAVSAHDDALSMSRPARVALAAGLLLLPPAGYLISTRVLTPESSSVALLPMSAGMVVPVLTVAAALWRKLERNTTSRTLRRLLVAEPLLLLASRLSSALEGATVAEAFVRDMLVLSGPLLLAAPLVTRALMGPGLAGVVLSLVCAQHPRWAMEGFVTFTAFTFLTTLAVWSRSDAAAARARPAQRTSAASAPST